MTSGQKARHRCVVFVSNMNDSPWGGSEELWAGAALRLATEGVAVGASVHRWSPPHARIADLARAGINVQQRRANYPLWRRALQKIIAPNKTPTDVEIVKFLTVQSPDLVVMSCTPYWLDLLEECVTRQLPFVTLSQANAVNLWPDDSTAAKYRRLMQAARRCFFVAKENQQLFENQIGYDLPNAEVIWNPFNVAEDVSVPWPELNESSELRLASVARLHPPSKGQDILLEALATPAWRNRNWRLTFYGNGPMRTTIELMAKRLGLAERVSLAGFVTQVETIWATNHAMVMPSRYEGMPLAILEAMLCARPVLATDVAYHAEVVVEGVTGFLAEAPTARSVGDALERLWENRTNLQTIGKNAAERIRAKVPHDPVQVFADKIKTAAGIA